MVFDSDRAEKKQKEGEEMSRYVDVDDVEAEVRR